MSQLENDKLTPEEEEALLNGSMLKRWAEEEEPFEVVHKTEDNIPKEQ